MSSVNPSNFQQIIDKHYKLMSSYNKALEEIDGNTFLKKFDYEIRSPYYYIKNKKISFVDFILSISFFMQFLTIQGSISFAINFKKIYVEKLPVYFIQRRIIRRIVVFLVKLHIRRQSEKFYELYLRKINTTSSVSEKSEVERLRTIASDLNDFYSIFPSSRQFYATLISIVFTIIGIVQFTELKSFIYDSINQVIEANDFALIVLLFFFYLIGIVSVLPLVHAFKVKRTIFLNTNSYYHFFDIYLKEGDEIYEKSIYKKENDLYVLLGLDGKKLPEFPIDTFAYILFGLGLIIFSMFFFYIDNSFNIEKISNQSSILIPLIIILSWYLLITPLLNNRQRKKFNLV